MASKIKSEDLRLNIIVGDGKGRKELQDLQKAIKEGKKEVDSLNKSYRDAVKQYGEASASAKKYKADLDNAKTSLDANKKKHAEISSTISLENKTLSELQKHLKATKTALSKAVPGTQNWNNLNREVKLTTERLRELKSQSEDTGQVLAGFGGTGMLAMFGLGVAGVVSGISSAVGKMKEFEQANANLSTILGKPVREIANLTENAMELGRTTEYTASQVTGLQTELAKLGFTEPQILSMTEPVLHFATAVGADLPEAAALAGATLRTFNLKAEDTEDLLSVLAVSTNKSALNFSYLQTAMSIVGPVAQSFGFSARDTISLLGSLANAGFDASSAATATRNILLNLANDSGKLAKELGGPVKSLDELIDGLAKLNDTGIDLAGTLELTDKRSVAAFNTFLSNTDGIRDLRDALEGVNGELDRIADERLDTLEGSTKKLQSAWEGFVLSLRGGTGILRDLADFATDVLGKITPKSPDEKAVRKFYRDVEKVYKKHGKEAGDEIVADMIKRQQNTADFWLVSLSNDSSRVASQLKTQVVRDAEAIVTAANQVMANLYSLPSGWTTQGTFITPIDNGDGGTDGNTPPPPVTPPSPTSKKSWSLSSDKEYLKARLELLKQYNAGEIKSKEEFDSRMNELELMTYEKRLANGKMSAEERLSVETSFQETIKKRQESVKADLKKQEEEQKKKSEDEKKLAKEAVDLINTIEAEEAKAKNNREKIKKAALEAEEARYVKEKEKFAGHTETLEAIERRHQVNIEKIKYEAFNRELTELETSHKQRRTKIEAGYAAQIATLKKGSGEELALKRKIDKDLLSEDILYLQAKEKKFQELFLHYYMGTIELSDEELKELKKRLNEVRKLIGDTQNSLNGSDKNWEGGAGGGSFLGVGQVEWEQFFANIKDGTMLAQNLATSMKVIGEAAKWGFNIAQQAIKNTNAKEQAEFKAWEKTNEEKKTGLEQRLKDGLMTQGQYDAEIKAMEEEKAAREEEMKLKQAKRQKAMQLSQAIINTAVSVTTTMAQFGYPLGLAFGILAAAMGAVEIGLIAKTPIESFGAAEGGMIETKRKQDGKRYPARLSPDKRGFVSTPTILVGEDGGEYVIPSDGVENPYLAPFINTIEYARRNGTLRSLRIEAAQPYITTASRAVGGYTGTGGTTVVTSGDPEMKRMLEKLMYRLDNPIAPEIPIAGSRGLRSQLDRYEAQRKRGRLG